MQDQHAAGGPECSKRPDRDLTALPFYGSWLVVAAGMVLTRTAESPAAHLGAFTIGMPFFGVIGVVCGLRAARHPGLDERTQRAWARVTASYVLLALSAPFFAIFSQRHQFPSPGDVLRLGFVPVLLVGLLSFPLHLQSRRERYKLALDVGVVVVGSCMAIWYLVVGPSVTLGQRPVRGLIAALAYPVGDIVLVFGAATVLLRGAAAASRRPLLLLVTALGFLIAGDVYLGYLRTHPVSQIPADWQFLCWMTGHFLLAAAAYEQCRQASGRRPVAVARPQLPSASRLPYLAVALGYGLLLAVAAGANMYPWGGLAVGAVAMTALVVARQVVTLRENHELAVTDGLTGLANRARLYEALQHALARGERNSLTVAVLLIDLNGFKQINDGHGHETGDQLLVEFARLLSRSVLGSDTVARLAGDEFAILLPDIGSPANATAVAERIVAGMYEPIPLSGRAIRPQGSIGVAVAGPAEVGPDELLQRADVAMDAAKRSGTACWRQYDNTLIARSKVDSRALSAELRQAVAGGQLRLCYQPIVALQSGELVGLEALVRWEHPRLGLLSPAAFIELAEDTGTIREIGSWVLAEACRQVAGWQRRLPGHRRLHLNVNLSPRELDDPGLAGAVLQTLTGTGLSPLDLVLEVTEGARMDDGVACRQLEALRAKGIRIALDDFGTGYSSLRRLIRLPVDVLKIDRCFVTNLGQNSESSAVAEAVVQLCQVLHLDSVAEGIEGVAQANALSLLGCRTGQGYHFGRPMRAGQIDALLDTAVHAWPTLPACSPAAGDSASDGPEPGDTSRAVGSSA
jgi:diguanylate cyclase (GGDEF)-like protein